MAFDIEQEKRNLDRYVSWWQIKYSSGGSCDPNCGCDCLSVQGEFESEAKISEVYYRFMNEHITAETQLSKARQAFWANLEFCKNFSNYFWMSLPLFDGDEQYYTWKTYLREELGIQEDESKREIWDINESGEDILVWERKYTIPPFLEISRKYKTWYDPFNDSYEEAY
jgi:hypothetical protein